MSLASATPREVIVYTAVDQLFSEPVFSDFEKKSGIHVRAVYDIEAVKSAGLVNRLLAEKDNPRCDVFWNSEILRTILLKRKGVLAAYHSPEADDIAAGYKDTDGFWTGFAGRARVLVVNTDLVAPGDYPEKITDLLAEKWNGKVAMANPLFGTTALQVAAIFASRGDEDSRDLFTKLQKNNIRIVDGNSVVRDLTGAGEVLVGLTDTDDVTVGIRSGMHIKAILPEDTKDFLYIPNTVALVAGAPHPQEAKELIDYLLSLKVEQQLCISGFSQVSLRKKMPVTQNTQKGQKSACTQLKENLHDYNTMASVMDKAVHSVQQIFMR